MTYTKERDEFLNIIQSEGIRYETALKLLRYATTLQRLAVAQCNGDWPADHGSEWKTAECVTCGSFWHPSVLKGKEKKCPDCRTGELVKKTLPEGFQAKLGGDPRGCVLKIQVPSGRTNDWGREGIAVPARER